MNHGVAAELNYEGVKKFMPDYVKIKIRRDTSANWASSNPVLALGEIGADTTLRKIKIGDGAQNWNNLPFYGGDMDIIDNLTSSRANAALSANQGKALKERIDDVERSISSGSGVTIADNLSSTSKTAALSANQGRVLNEKINNVEQSISSGSSGGGGVTVIDNLTSSSATSALSANQGRELKSQIDTVQQSLATGGVSVVDNLTSSSATSALSANQGRALNERINSVEQSISSGSSVNVVDNLSSTSTADALSANQGHELKSQIDNKADKSEVEELSQKIGSAGIFGMGYTIDSINGYSKPTRITFEDGVVANLTWSGTRLDSIVASTGEKITINYNMNGLIIGRTVTRS